MDLEPIATSGTTITEKALLSIAVSLKRLADTTEKNDEVADALRSATASLRGRADG